MGNQLWDFQQVQFDDEKKIRVCHCKIRDPVFHWCWSERCVN
jgi:hypothetical protein